MNETLKKLTAEIKAALAERIKTAEWQDFFAKTKAAEDTGSFEVVISTDNMDRQGESIDQNGWDLAFYQTNPIVLWAHDYYALPIGVTDEIKVENGRLIARGRFAAESANPFAQQVRRLYDLKIVRATSVGFIVKEASGGKITKAELLEFSFVPVPANPFALSLRKAQELRLDLGMLAMKGVKLEVADETKGAVPFASHGTAPEDEAWDATKVQNELWGDGTNQKKYAQAHAWFDSNANDDDGDGLPDIKGAYKLPHHNADLKANWNGVAAAMAALLGARGGVDVGGDKDAVYAHLAKHYAEFDKTPPEKSVKAAEGDPCTLNDGTEGVMQPDEQGNLVCMPKVEEKPTKGAVADEVALDTAREQKWEKLDPIMDIIDAFFCLFLDEQTPIDQFDALLAETAALLQAQVGAGTQPTQASVAGYKGTGAIKRAEKMDEPNGTGEHPQPKEPSAEETAAPTETEQGDEGEEQPEGAAPEQRSSSAGFSEKELAEFFQTRDVLRLINTVTSNALAQIKKRGRVASRKNGS